MLRRTYRDVRAVDVDILVSMSAEMPAASSAVQRQASADICGWSVFHLTCSNVSSVLCYGLKNLSAKGMSYATSYTD